MQRDTITETLRADDVFDAVEQLRRLREGKSSAFVPSIGHVLDVAAKQSPPAHVYAGACAAAWARLAQDKVVGVPPGLLRDTETILGELSIATTAGWRATPEQEAAYRAGGTQWAPATWVGTGEQPTFTLQTPGNPPLTLIAKGPVTPDDLDTIALAYWNYPAPLPRKPDGEKMRFERCS